MKKIITLLAVTSISLVACNQQEVVVQTKEGDITQQDIVKQISDPVYGQAAFEAICQKLLRSEYKDKMDEKKLKDQVAAEIKVYGGKDKFEKLIQQQQPGMTVEKYEEGRLNEAYREKFLNDNIKIDDRFLKENVRHITTVHIPVNKENDEKSAKAKADKVIGLLKASKLSPEKIEEKAGKNIFPQDVYVVKGQGNPQAEQVIFSLKEGEISEPIKTEQGYDIFKREAIGKLDKNVDTQLKMQMRQSSQKTIKSAYEKLFKKYDVKFKSDILEEAVKMQLKK